MIDKPESTNSTNPTEAEMHLEVLKKQLQDAEKAVEQEAMKKEEATFEDAGGSVSQPSKASHSSNGEMYLVWIFILGLLCSSIYLYLQNTDLKVALDKTPKIKVFSQFDIYGKLDNPEALNERLLQSTQYIDNLLKAGYVVVREDALAVYPASMKITVKDVQTVQNYSDEIKALYTKVNETVEQGEQE